MKSKISMMVIIGCIAIASGLGTAWFAYGQTTNVPVALQMPLVRDLKLVSDVENLARRVEELEAKVKILESKGGKAK